MRQNRHLLGLDIGADQVRAAVGRVDDSGKLEVLALRSGKAQAKFVPHLFLA